VTAAYHWTRFSGGARLICLDSHERHLAPFWHFSSILSPDINTTTYLFTDLSKCEGSKQTGRPDRELSALMMMMMMMSIAGIIVTSRYIPQFVLYLIVTAVDKTSATFPTDFMQRFYDELREETLLADHHVTQHDPISRAALAQACTVCRRVRLTSSFGDEYTAQSIRASLLLRFQRGQPPSVSWCAEPKAVTVNSSQ